MTVYRLVTAIALSVCLFVSEASARDLLPSFSSRSLKEELVSKIDEIEEIRRDKVIEISALQATVRNLQGEVEDSSNLCIELQSVEVSH